MKAEHRKELQTNELADHMGRWIQGIKKKPSREGYVILAFVLAVVGLLVGWAFYAKGKNKERSHLWVELGEAATLEDLDKLASEHAKSLPGKVSRFQRARVLMHDGLNLLCAPELRPTALKNLEEAEQLYTDLVQEGAESPALLQEAMMGIATAREARGELDAAQESYQALAKRFPQSPQGKAAETRGKQLAENKEVAGFYGKLNDLAEGKDKSSGK